MHKLARNPSDARWSRFNSDTLHLRAGCRMTRETLSPEAKRDFTRRVLLRITLTKIERALVIRERAKRRREARPC